MHIEIYPYIKLDNHKVKIINSSVEEYGETYLDSCIYLPSAHNTSPPLSSVKKDVEHHCRLIAWLPLNIALTNMKIGLYVNIKINDI